MTRTLSRAALLLLPLLAAAGCGQDATEGSEPSGGTAGTSPNTGGAASATGGAGAGGTGAGGAPAGGAPAGGTGAGTSATGGTGAGTGGTAAGAGGSASGGSGSGGTAGSGGTGGGASGEPTFHIFMLMGQSNMAGVAKREPSDDNTDERLKVLGGCNQPAGQWNIAKPPLNDCPGEKGWNLSDSVDPGTWFGKTLLTKLPPGDTIGLVGTAESGESITTFISGGSHHQMILNKIAKAKTAPNARFAGVIFHQGESDSGQNNNWPAKVVQLYNEVKAAWGVDYDVPFILGELPAGGCCSGHNTQVHAAADLLPKGYWISQQGTNVEDQYHFDHSSVVLMGKRYGEKMIEALGW